MHDARSLQLRRRGLGAILGANRRAENCHTPPSFFALTFHDGLVMRNIDERALTASSIHRPETEFASSNHGDDVIDCVHADSDLLASAVDHWLGLFNDHSPEGTDCWVGQATR